MSDLRQRTSSQAAKIAEGATALASDVRKEKERSQAFIKAALEGKLGQGTADMLAPVCAVFVALSKVFAPFIVQGWGMASAFYAQLPTDVVMCIFGLGLCLFGGVFQASIAAVEAFKLCGWNKTKGYLLDIHKQVRKVIDANEDKQKLASMPADKLLAYELDLVLTHVEPEVVRNAYAGLFGAVMGVIATLQSEFAKTVALGTAIANAFKQTGAKHITPVLAHTLDKKHHQWIPVIVDTIAKSLACTIAWFLQRIISAVHSAVRGASLVVHHGIKVLKSRGMLQDFDEDQSNLDECAAAAIALMGFWFQFKGGFQLSFPLNIILLPLTFVEWLITFIVGTSVHA